MAASYPSAAKSFTAINAGDTVTDTMWEDAYDEITAIEQALISSLAHDLKFTDALYDIGKSGATRPRDGFFSRNVTIGGTLTVDGGQSTWTPTDASGAALSLTVTTAIYVKLGRHVIATADITYPATANASQAQIGGLPVANSATSGSGAQINYHNATVTDGIIGNIASGASAVSFYKGAGGASVLNSDMSGRTIRFSAIYLAAA